MLDYEKRIVEASAFASRLRCRPERYQEAVSSAQHAQSCPNMDERVHMSLGCFSEEAN